MNKVQVEVTKGGVLTAIEFEVLHPRNLLMVGHSDKFRSRISLLELSFVIEDVSPPRGHFLTPIRTHEETSYAQRPVRQDMPRDHRVHPTSPSSPSSAGYLQ